MSEAFAYYPGCSLHGTSKEYDMSVRQVCSRLGIGLEEMKDWICCGATPVHATNPKLASALATNNLSIAQGMGKDVAVACSACFSRMKTASVHLADDPSTRADINRIAGTAYEGGTDVQHIVSIIEEHGVDKVEKAVTKRLEGLKVACYYGCLMLRPPKVAQVDDPENPTIMERVLRATGAEPIEWNFKTECCGAGFSVPRVDIVLKLVNDIIGDAKKRGADVIAVACPLCHVNLDMRLAEVEKAFKTSLKMPVLYFTQLLGLAMGASAKELGLGKVIVSPMNMLREKKLI